MHKLFVLILFLCPFMAFAQKEEVILPSGLIVAASDEYGIFTWAEAKKKCEDKGYGWALPTNEELLDIYNNRESIKSITTGWYWSLTQDTSHFKASNDNYGLAWNLIFSNGSLVSNLKTYTLKARCVKHK